MLSTADLLAAAMRSKGLSSVAAFAREMGFPEKSVYRWSQGKNIPEDDAVRQLAEVAGLDPAEVVAMIRVERATEPAMNALWASIAQRLHAAGATAAAVILSAGIGGGGDASAAPLRPAADAPALAWLAQFTSYILARLLRRFAGSRQAAVWPIAAPCCT